MQQQHLDILISDAGEQRSRQGDDWSDTGGATRIVSDHHRQTHTNVLVRSGSVWESDETSCSSLNPLHLNKEERNMFHTEHTNYTHNIYITYVYNHKAMTKVHREMLLLITAKCYMQEAYAISTVLKIKMPHIVTLLK